MDFHEVFLDPFLRPLNIPTRYDQTARTAAAFLAAFIGTDSAGDAGVDEDCVQLFHPVQITLPDHDFVLYSLSHEPFLFLLHFLKLLGQEEERAAVSAFFNMRDVLGFALRTYLVQVHGKNYISRREGRRGRAHFLRPYGLQYLHFLARYGIDHLIKINLLCCRLLAEKLLDLLVQVYGDLKFFNRPVELTLLGL